MFPPAGTPKFELDTPALCVDLDAFEANIARMAGVFREHGKAWRPHAKGHKSPAIAHKQLAAGAIGLTCAKVSEAEVMAAAGIRDLLIANMVVGSQKLERIASLCRHADPIVACDHFAQAEALAATCRERGVTCRVLIEVNIGMDRVGTRPGRDTLDLAEGIDRLAGIKLVGVMGYEGHLLTIADPEEKRRRIADAVGLLVRCRDQFHEKGLCCDIVSAGGTGSYAITATIPGVTEIQAGGGIFADPFYQLQCGLTGHQYALTVLATVVSRPTFDRAILDSGRKSINLDLQPPLVKGYPEAVATPLSAEHCYVQLGPQSREWKIGDKVELIVGYSDFTTMLHDQFYACRGDRLEVIWPILARGKLQ